MTAPDENQATDPLATGGLVPTGQPEGESRIIICSFGPYEVSIRISNDDKFLGIAQIAVKNDFRSPKQKIESRGYHDLTNLYDT